MNFVALFSRPVLMSCIALGAGAASYVGATKLLQTKSRAVEQSYASRYRPREVLVAAQALSAGTAVSSNQLARRAVPEQFLPIGAADPNDVDRFLGRKILHDTGPGDVIRDSDLQSAAMAGLAERLHAELRAVTFNVTETSAQAGLLAPGDHVDLLYAAAQGGRGAEHVQLWPLLQDVSVIATGPKVVPSEPYAEAERSFATITVAVTPRDASKIVLAERLGELTAVLRAAGDRQVVNWRAVDARNLRLSDSVDSRRRRAPVAPQRLEILLADSGRIVRTSLPVAAE